MDKICGNCNYFVRHYVFSAHCFTEIEHGHCGTLGLKNRKTLQKACDHFEEKAETPPIKVIEISIKERELQR